MEFINPWSSQQYKDYAKLRDQFGIEEFNFDLPDAPPLFRRGVIFGHRGFEYVYDAIKNNHNFAVLTGLMPSGKMHFGHKMTIDQVVYYQNLGADIHIAVADIEAYASRGLSLEKAKDIAINEYIPSYIALGLDPDKAEVYFQSRRQEVKDIAWKLARKVNMSEFLAIYGFGGETNMSHIFAPLIQVGDILHVQLEKFGGPRATIVPVGVDQDPHMRLTRDIVDRWRMFSISPQKDGLGVFYKGEDVERRLKEAMNFLQNEGFSDFKLNIPYKALYIRDASSNDLIRVNRALIQYERSFNPDAFYPPAATYHRLMTGLTGGKMSSSVPESAIFLTDSPEDARKKVMRAKTGGGVTLEEHRRYGGKPDECTVYELFVYHLIGDDKYLKEIREECERGERVCGPCKKEAAEIISQWLKEFQEKREQAKEIVPEIISWD
jgi:tryptophanyl-tRNA synthetase